MDIPGFDLNSKHICTPDTVITMRHGVHNQFCPAELRVFRNSPEHSPFSEFRIFPDLRLHKSNSIFYLIQDPTGELHIFHNIHPVAHFGRSAFIAHKTNASARENLFSCSCSTIV